MNDDRATADRLTAKLQAFHDGLDADEQRLFATLVEPDDDVDGYAENAHLYFRAQLRGIFDGPVAPRELKAGASEVLMETVTMTCE